MIKIFVSHAWDDKVHDQFGQLTRELKNFDLIVDKTRLKPGQMINAQVFLAIQDSEIVLVLWSAQAAASPDVEFEIAAAVSMGKTVLPCIIDDYPTDHSPDLKGKLYIDLRSSDAMEYPELGWMKVRYFLVDYYLDKMELRIAKYEADKQKEARVLLNNLKISQQEQQLRISLLEDSVFRKKMDAMGRNRNNSYVQNMTDQIIAEFSDNPKDRSRKQVADFFRYSKSLFEQFPTDDDATVLHRNKNLLNKMAQLDPEGKNRYLSAFKQGL